MSSRLRPRDLVLAQLLDEHQALTAIDANQPYVDLPQRARSPESALVEYARPAGHTLEKKISTVRDALKTTPVPHTHRST
jgi:hypothetical protein